jgi:hypothetical protein
MFVRNVREVNAKDGRCYARDSAGLNKILNSRSSRDLDRGRELKGGMQKETRQIEKERREETRRDEKKQLKSHKWDSIEANKKLKVKEKR